MVLSQTQLIGIYYGFLASLILLAGFVLIWRLRKNQQKRLRAVSRIKQFESLITETPLDNNQKVAQEHAVENINSRHSLIRRIILPTIIALAFPVAIVPFLTGAPSVYVSLFIGTFTVIVGIAAKPLIENIISGVVISLGHPLRVGDTVEVDGQYGTVEHIALTYTVIKVWDWTRYVIPNQKLLNKEYINFSVYDRFIWARVEFYVAPETDLKLVEQLAIAAGKESPYFGDYEDPAVWVMGLEKDAIRLWVAAWADTPSKAWQLKHDMRMNLCRSLKEHGIRWQLSQHQVSSLDYNDLSVPTPPPVQTL